MQRDFKEQMDAAVAAAARQAVSEKEETLRALEAQLTEARRTREMAEADMEEARKSAMVRAYACMSARVLWAHWHA